MVNNSTNINKTNNHLLPLLTVRKKMITTYEGENQDTHKNVAEFTDHDNWISNGNAYAQTKQ